MDVAELRAEIDDHWDGPKNIDDRKEDQRNRKYVFKVEHRFKSFKASSIRPAISLNYFETAQM